MHAASSPTTRSAAGMLHTVAWPVGTLYSCTGDHDKPEGFEVHWLRHL